MGHKELDTTEIRALSLFGAGGGTYRQNAEIHMNCQRSPSTLHPGLDTESLETGLTREQTSSRLFQICPK